MAYFIFDTDLVAPNGIALPGFSSGDTVVVTQGVTLINEFNAAFSVGAPFSEFIMSGTVISENTGLFFGPSFLGPSAEVSGLISATGSVITNDGIAVVLAGGATDAGNELHLNNQGTVSSLTSEGVAMAKAEHGVFTNSGDVSSAVLPVAFREIVYMDFLNTGTITSTASSQLTFLGTAVLMQDANEAGPFSNANFINDGTISSQGNALLADVRGTFEGTNSGLMQGDVDIDAGFGGFFTNTGAISGNVEIAGVSFGLFAFNNLGTITENVTFNSAALARNDGTILGNLFLSDNNDVYFGSGEGVVSGFISGGDGSDLIFGAARNDNMQGDAGNDTIAGGDGDDVIRGGLDNDILRGNAGADELRGEAGDDMLAGGAGDDTLIGREGDDTLRGNAGEDSLEGGEDDDSLSGGSGDDYLEGNAGDDTLNGGAGGDDMRGDNGADRLNGNTGDDTLNGGGDNDTLRAGSDNDSLIGGNGDDFLFGDAGADELFGGNDADRLRGGSGDDSLNGGAGDDDLRGGTGSDTIEGGAGRDQLFGGADGDVFVFHNAGDSGTGSAADTIRDFAQGEDVIDLELLVAGELEFNGTGGYSGGGAASVRYIVTTQGVSVRIDTDGLGGTELQFTVAGVSSVEAADFIL